MVRSTTCVLRYPSAVYGGPSHPGISWGSSTLMSVVLGGAKTAQARRATRPLPSERCPPPPPAPPAAGTWSTQRRSLRQTPLNSLCRCRLQLFLTIHIYVRIKYT